MGRKGIGMDVAGLITKKTPNLDGLESAVNSFSKCRCKKNAPEEPLFLWADFQVPG